MIEQKTNHVIEALNNLIHKFKNKPRITGFITAQINQVQAFENACFTVVAVNSLLNSSGETLDGDGSVVGEAREGRSDLDYRAAIRARIILNLSYGRCEDIIALLQAISNIERVRVMENFPASFVAQIIDPIDPDYIPPNKIRNMVSACRSAGVKSITLFGVEGSFRYDSGPGYDVGPYGGAVS